MSNSYERDLLEMRRSLEETVKRLGMTSIENERLNREVTDLRSRVQSSTEIISLKNQISTLTQQITTLTSTSQQDRLRLDMLKSVETENDRLQSELIILKG